MSTATLRWIGGPVLRATTHGTFHLYEAVHIAERRLLGEVIQITSDEIVAQVYEDTTGLQPGDSVLGTQRQLSARLGPGLLGHIFDGLLRPLEGTDSVFISTGAAAAKANTYGFEPRSIAGTSVAGGSAIGVVQTGGIPQRQLVPPTVAGKLEWIAASGDYAEDATIARIRDAAGVVQELSMVQWWPVRQPRPVADKLPPSGPLVTGQRILDTLFPVARGGRAALPGGFGTGKTVLQEALAKWCDADAIVYVGCGERGNEMAEVLAELPQLEDPRRSRPLMERTVIIANTSNMPVAAREASIYTAITVAEYLRDQGMHVALMADSTSRWAEALREVSGRLGELPGEAGYPAYLSSRLAEYYERAARVRTLDGAEGSITIIGAISPPAGDFSEPVTMHTKRYVRSFWALDRERAQARFYPAIHPLISYSEDAVGLAQWWKLQGNPDWLAQRQKLLTLLEQQARLERMVRIVGKEALPPAQQLILLCAELVNECVLRQSALSQVDRYCSPARQTAILAAVMLFVRCAERAIGTGISPDQVAALPVHDRLRRAPEEFGEQSLPELDALKLEIEQQFHTLRPGGHDAADARS